MDTEYIGHMQYGTAGGKEETIRRFMEVYGGCVCVTGKDAGIECDGVNTVNQRTFNLQ